MVANFISELTGITSKLIITIIIVVVTISVCACACTHMSMPACGVQRTTFSVFY